MSEEYVLYRVARADKDASLQEFMDAFQLREDEVNVKRGLMKVAEGPPSEYAIEMVLVAAERLRDRDGWQVSGPFENGLVPDASGNWTSGFLRRAYHKVFG